MFRKNSGTLLNIEGLVYEGFEEYFKRDKGIARPHNDFANLININSQLVNLQEWDKNMDESHFQFGKMKEFADNPPEAANEIYFQFGMYPQYNPKFAYDENLQEYLRFYGTEKHLDQATGGQLRAANILVQFTNYWAVDDEGRLEFKTYGSGVSLLFRDGKVLKGTWQKEPGGKTRFLGANGDEFNLRPGQTWVEVVNEEWRVKWE